MFCTGVPTQIVCQGRGSFWAKGIRDRHNTGTLSVVVRGEAGGVGVLLHATNNACMRAYFSLFVIGKWGGMSSNSSSTGARVCLCVYVRLLLALLLLLQFVDSWFAFSISFCVRAPGTNGCPLDEYMCAHAAQKGHLAVLQWAEPVVAYGTRGRARTRLRMATLLFCSGQAVHAWSVCVADHTASYFAATQLVSQVFCECTITACCGVGRPWAGRRGRRECTIAACCDVGMPRAGRRGRCFVCIDCS